MKQFIEKTDKVYAFFHDQIFANYKQIGELTGKDWSFSFSNDRNETVNISRRIDNGYEMFSCGNNQVLVIKNKQLRIVPKVDFDSCYEEINKETIVVKHILTDNPLTDNPLTNPINPFTGKPFPRIPNQPYL